MTQTDSTAPIPQAPTSSQRRFEVRRLLSKGGMGIVCVAWDRVCGREVALKFLRAELAGNIEANNRLAREAVVMSQMRHPGVPSVFDMGVDPGGRTWYAMRLIEGCEMSTEIAAFRQHLPRRLDRSHRPLRELLQHLSQVAQTVHWAHQHGYLHRDIKPANIIVSRHGETVLLDWGLAGLQRTSSGPLTTGDTIAQSISLGQSTDQPHDDLQTVFQTAIPVHSHQDTPIDPQRLLDSDLTQYAVRLGTPAYMATEMESGQWHEIDQRSDIYLLGATMFQLLTGVAPHANGRRRSGALRQHLQQTKVAPPLIAICMKALRDRTQLRYETASDFAEDIQHYLADEPILACPDDWTQWLGRRFRRHWRVAVPGSLILVTASVAFGIVTTVREQARTLTLNNRLLQSERQAAALEAQRQREQKEVAQYYRAVSDLQRLVRQQPVGWSNQAAAAIVQLYSYPSAAKEVLPQVRGLHLEAMLGTDAIDRSIILQQAQEGPTFKAGCFAEHPRSDLVAVGEAKAGLFLRMGLTVGKPNSAKWYSLSTLSLSQGAQNLLAQKPQPGLRALCFSTDGRSLFAGTRDGQVLWWRIPADHSEQQWDRAVRQPDLLHTTGTITALAIADDQSALYVANNQSWLHRVALDNILTTADGKQALDDALTPVTLPIEFQPDNSQFVAQPALRSKKLSTRAREILFVDQQVIISPATEAALDRNSLEPNLSSVIVGEGVSVLPDRRNAIVSQSNGQLLWVDERSGDTTEVLAGRVTVDGQRNLHQGLTQDGQWLVRTLQGYINAEVEIWSLIDGSLKWTLPLEPQIEPELLVERKRNRIWIAQQTPLVLELTPFDSRAGSTVNNSAVIQRFAMIGSEVIFSTDSATYAIAKGTPELFPAPIDGAFDHAVDLSAAETVLPQYRCAMITGGKQAVIHFYQGSATQLKRLGEVKLGREVLLADRDRQGRLWCAVHGENLKNYSLVGFAPDSFERIDTEGLREFDLQTVHQPTSMAIAGKLATVGLVSGSIDIYDLEKKKQIGQCWSGVAQKVRCLAFAPDPSGSRFACGRQDGGLMLFTLDSAGTVANSEPISQPTVDDAGIPSPVTAILWLDEQHLLSARENGLFQIHRVSAPQTELVLEAQLPSPCFQMQLNDHRLWMRLLGERAIRTITVDSLEQLLASGTAVTLGT